MRALAALMALAVPAAAFAETPPLPALPPPPPVVGAPGDAAAPGQDNAQDSEPRAPVSFNAVFAPGDIQAIGSGLIWRVFDARSDVNGGHALVAELNDPAPTFQLPDGDYIVHAACGLAGADQGDRGQWRAVGRTAGDARRRAEDRGPPRRRADRAVAARQHGLSARP